jgi:hypothetical protein
MINRKLHHWKAIIADRAGNTKNVDVFSYWKPDFFDDTASHIAGCAAAEHNVFVDRTRGPNGEYPWLPVSAKLV